MGNETLRETHARLFPVQHCIDLAGSRVLQSRSTTMLSLLPQAARISVPQHRLDFRDSGVNKDVAAADTKV